jgi:hypothetical protein
MNFNDSLDDIVPLSPSNPIIFDNYKTLGLVKYTSKIVVVKIFYYLDAINLF